MPANGAGVDGDVAQAAENGRACEPAANDQQPTRLERVGEAGHSADSEADGAGDDGLSRDGGGVASERGAAVASWCWRNTVRGCREEERDA